MTLEQEFNTVISNIEATKLSLAANQRSLGKKGIDQSKLLNKIETLKNNLETLKAKRDMIAKQLDEKRTIENEQSEIKVETQQKSVISLRNAAIVTGVVLLLG